jgi:hypothetical protein
LFTAQGALRKRNVLSMDPAGATRVNVIQALRGGMPPRAVDLIAASGL